MCTVWIFGKFRGSDLCGKCCWRAKSCSPTTFPIQIFKITLLVDIFDMLSISGNRSIIAHKSTENKSRDGLAAKSLFLSTRNANPYFLMSIQIECTWLKESINKEYSINGFEVVKLNIWRNQKKLLLQAFASEVWNSPTITLLEYFLSLHWVSNVIYGVILI